MCVLRQDENVPDGINGTAASDLSESVQDADLLSDEASYSALDFEDDRSTGLPAMTRTYSLSEASENPILVDDAYKEPCNSNHAPLGENASLPSTGILGLATAPLMFLGRSADNLLKEQQPRGVEALTLSQIVKQQKKAQARQETLAELEARVREHQKAVPEFLTKSFEFLMEHGMFSSSFPEVWVFQHLPCGGAVDTGITVTTTLYTFFHYF